MNNKITNILSIIIALIIILIPSLALAQIDPGGGVPGDPGTPIDGGASLLVGAAAVYGMKKLKTLRQAQDDKKQKQK